MTTVRQYMANARPVQVKVGQRMGLDLDRTPAWQRVLYASTLAIICVVVKLLVDKGVFTDAELQAAFNAAGADAYDPEPDTPPGA